MKKFYKIMASAMAVIMCFGNIVSAAEIKPSLTSVVLEQAETSFSFDVILKTQEDFAGAEFAMKPSSDDIKIDLERGVEFLEDVSAFSTVKAERDGAVYFGFFGGGNNFPAKEYKVARLTYTYSGTQAQSIRLIESSIVTVNDDGKTTSSDSSSASFTVRISRKGSGGGGGGGGGGSAVDPAVQRVIDLINKIGKVGEGSKADIENARKAYDNLTDRQKTQVVNYKNLTDAEKVYAELNQNNQLKPQPADPENPKPFLGSNKFEDVAGEDWFDEAVGYVFEKGFMYGTSNNIFEPQTTLSRAMLVTILYRMEGEAEVSGESPFEDIEEGQWYTKAVKWGSQKDIVRGYGDGNFGPHDNITREQMSLMIMKYCRLKGISTDTRDSLERFTDKDKVGDWAFEAVSWAVSQNLMSGRTPQTLVSYGTATRAEAASVLMRVNEYILKK